LKIKGSVVAKIEDLFRRKGGKIIFYVKATTGLCFITFVLAGTVKMKFSKFAKFSLLGGFVWSAFLVTVGWFFGYAAGQISQYIKYAGLIIFVGARIFFVGLTLYKRKQTEEILE
jgi:membrane protein DedA with SNARE-associated domain